MLTAQNDPVALEESPVGPVKDFVVKLDLIAELIGLCVPDIDPFAACRKQMSAVAVRQQIRKELLGALQNCAGRYVLIFEVGVKFGNIQIQGSGELILGGGQNIHCAGVCAKQRAGL